MRQSSGQSNGQGSRQKKTVQGQKKMTQNPKKAMRGKKKRIKPDSFDFTVLFVALTLMLFGVVMIFSASYYTTMTAEKTDYDMFYYLKRQSIWVVTGTVAMVFCMNIPYTFWKRFALFAYWLSNFFLFLLPFIGIEAGGQKRWIGVGPMQFQPSEFTKLALVLYFSIYIMNHRQELGNIKGFFKALVVLAIPVGLIAMSNFSSALLILLMGMTMLFIGSPKIWYFVAGLGVIIPAGILAVVLFPYRLGRIKIWLDPWSDPIDKGFQTIQGLYAVASGGIFGLGLGQSRQKTFVPESHNDIIFSIICEELGLIGAGLVIVLFAVLIWRGVKIAMNAKDTYGTLMATGIVSVIAFQSIINMGVVTNTIPNTGQPLPFISYGGTSLLFLMIMVGLLLNISRYQKE